MNPLLFLFFALVITTHRAESTTNDSSTLTALTDERSIVNNNDVITVLPYRLTTPDSSQQHGFQRVEDSESSETTSINRFEDPSTINIDYSSVKDRPEEPPEHSIPYTEHEDSEDVPTGPKYVSTGAWARPPEDKNVPLDFVPTKLYAQVRGRHTVTRVPQEEAIKEAKSDEERENAPRLREVVTDSKVNTVYTEEGYEDSAYDHAGHIRDADYHEGFARKLHDQLDEKQRSVDEKKNVGEGGSEDDGYENVDVKQFDDYDDDYRDHYEEIVEPRRLSGKDYPVDSATHAKLVTENGIEKLQKDLEREDQEIERGLESSEVQEQEVTSEQNNNNGRTTELIAPYRNYEHDDQNNQPSKVKTKERRPTLQNAGRGNENDGRSRKRIRDSEVKRTEDIPKEAHETTITPIREIFSTNAALPDTTLNTEVPEAPVTNPLELFPSTFPENSLPYSSPSTTFSSTTEDGPTTISYAHLFWDFFKSRQQATTIPNSADEETATILPIVNGRKPYHVVANEESLHSRNSPSGSSPTDGEFSTNDQHDEHRPNKESKKNNYIPSRNSVITKAGVLDYDNLSSFPVEKAESNGWKASSSPVNELSGHSPAISATSSLIRSDDRNEEVNVDYASSRQAGPAPDDAYVTVRRKPRYKLLVRPKPKKTKLESAKRDSANPSTANYLKMLSYIKNNGGRAQDAHPSIHRGGDSVPSKKKNEAKNPPRVHPPVPRLASEVAYSNFLPEHRSQPGATIESEVHRRGNWNEPSTLPQEIRPSSYPDPFTIVEPQSLGYRGVPVPATGLLPPAPIESDYAKYRSYGEGGDYLVHLDAGTLGYAPLGYQARRRRATRRGKNDEIVKAAARNGTSNRSGSEKYVPDTSGTPAKRAIQKKSRLRGMTDGRRELSHERLHKTNDVINGGESGENLSTRKKKAAVAGNEGTLDDADGRTAEVKETVYGSSKKVKRSTTGGKSISNSSPRSRLGKRDKKTHEELLGDSPRVTSDVIERELSARFKKNETENESAGEYEQGRKVEVEVPEFDYVDELVEEDHPTVTTTTETALNLKKYPFYTDNRIPSTSALRYIVDPRIVPQKTVGGTEFYESRDAYKQCDEIEPNLAEVVPKTEEPLPQEGQNEDPQRLRGLGEKLDCYKAKYFDENPFDNPLFSEMQVEEASPPRELNPKQFSSRITFFPKENNEYIVQRPSRKPESDDHRRQKQNVANSAKVHGPEGSIRVNFKHSPRTSSGRNAYLHSQRPLAARSQKGSRRQKQKGMRKRPVSTVTEPSTLYPTAPYQNQVYEDVMGNIRHMVNSYKVYEPDAEQPTIPVPSSTTSNVKLSIPNTPTSFYFGNSDVIDITDSPSNVNVLNVEGLIPPHYVAKRPVGFKRNRVAQRNRVRQEKPLPTYRVIGHYQKVQIHKRSVVDGDLPVKQKNPSTTNSRQNDQSAVKELFDNKENEKAKTEYLVKTPDLIVAGNVVATRRRKSKNSNNTSNVEKEPKNEESHRVVYTIRDRIRHSKPKAETKRIGKFVGNETTLDEDRRRKEPRYNVLKRKKGQYSSESFATTPPTSTNKIALIELNTDISLTERTLNKGVELETRLEPTEVQQSQLSTSTTITGTSVVTEKPENYSKISTSSAEKLDRKLGSSTTDRPVTGYAVHENVDEDIKTTTSIPQTSTTTRDFDRLKAYLESDPPGYAEAFSEEATNSSLTNADTITNNSSATKNHDQKEETEQQREKDQDGFKQFHRSYISTEESTEKVNEDIKTPPTSKSDESASNESSSENSTSKEDSSSFFLSSSRPTSPAMDFEDRRYSDLGPRLNKPAFYHPPFSMPSSEDYSASGSKEYERKGSDVRKDYIFPWYRKKDAEAEIRDTGFRIRPLDRFEFPWERRERLAREKERKDRERYERLKEILSEEDDDVVATKDRKRQIYPWDRYDGVKGRTDGKRYIWQTNDSAGEESSNGHRPTMKFSSRYSSKSTKLPIGDKPVRGTAATVEEASEEKKKILDEDSEDKSASIEVEDDSTDAKKIASTERTRGISRGMIVPEDVTLAPRRKNERKKSTKSVNSEIGRSKTNSTNENLDKSESQISSVSTKSNINGINANNANSSKHVNGKRRRTVTKTLPTSTVETSTKSAVEDISRNRRKQRIPSAHVATTTPASVLTPSPSRNVRRKPQRQIGEARETKGPTSDGKGLTAESTRNASTKNGRRFRSSNRVPSKEKEQNSSTQQPPTRSSKGRRKQMMKNDEISEKTIEEHEEEKRKETQENLKKPSSPVTSEENLDGEVKNCTSFGFKDGSAQIPDDLGTFDPSSDDEEDKASFKSALKTETHLPSNLLQSVSQLPKKDIQRINTSKNEWIRPNPETNGSKEKESSEAGREEDEEEGNNRDELRARYIKDPEQRLYYYVER